MCIYVHGVFLIYSSPTIPLHTLSPGIFYNAHHTALCWVNEEDHCRIISMQDGGDIGGVFKRFCDLSGALSVAAADNYTNLMWNEKLGFLGIVAVCVCVWV
ncbi:hypothetical protein EON63_08235 [archaeon]|nr:MAG: hypothetical protein EON63_08235 [archaeon]